MQKKKKKASRVNVIWLANRIAGVMKQVDKAMAKDEAERLKRILNKELGAIHEVIKWETLLLILRLLFLGLNEKDANCHAA